MKISCKGDLILAKFCPLGYVFIQSNSMNLYEVEFSPKTNSGSKI